MSELLYNLKPTFDLSPEKVKELIERVVSLCKPGEEEFFRGILAIVAEESETAPEFCLFLEKLIDQKEKSNV